MGVKLTDKETAQCGGRCACSRVKDISVSGGTLVTLSHIHTGRGISWGGQGRGDGTLS